MTVDEHKSQLSGNAVPDSTPVEVDAATAADTQDYPAPTTLAAKQAEEYYFSLSLALDYIRAQSYDSQLVTPGDLALQDLAPDWMPTDAHQSLLLAFLAGEGTASAAARYAIASDADAAANASIKDEASRYSSSAGRTDSASDTTNAACMNQPGAHSSIEEFTTTFLSLPPLDVQDIARLDGSQTSYYYSQAKMSDPYAKWAFLAKEDDALAIFAYVIREDSRVYPRPTTPGSLTNEPFCLTEEEVWESWKTAQTLPEYADIQTCQASNGDAYFFSTDYMSKNYARSLAEYRSVERFYSM